MITCPTCSNRFLTHVGLQAHQRAKIHSYCERCDKYFAHEQALYQHDTTVHYCKDCDRWFDTKQALEYHLRNSRNHRKYYPCDKCEIDFDTRQALDEHLRCSRSHVSYYTCDGCGREVDTKQAQQHLLDSPYHNCFPCNRNFGTLHALEQHVRNSPNHAVSHFSCCGRAFNSAQDLNQHLRDKIHYPKPQIPKASSSITPITLDILCPSGSSCTRRFDSLSAALQHLDSGACSSGITRQNLATYVQLADANRLPAKSSSGASKKVTAIIKDTKSKFAGRDVVVKLPALHSVGTSKGPTGFIKDTKPKSSGQEIIVQSAKLDLCTQNTASSYTSPMKATSAMRSTIANPKETSELIKDKQPGSSSAKPVREPWRSRRIEIIKKATGFTEGTKGKSSSQEITSNFSMSHTRDNIDTTEKFPELIKDKKPASSSQGTIRTALTSEKASEPLIDLESDSSIHDTEITPSTSNDSWYMTAGQHLSKMLALDPTASFEPHLSEMLKAVLQSEKPSETH